MMNDVQLQVQISKGQKEFSGIDFDRLSDWHFQDMDFHICAFHDLAGVKFTNCKLRYCRFTHMDEVNIYSSDCSYIVFEGCGFQRYILFKDTLLNYADFRGANYGFVQYENMTWQHLHSAHGLFCMTVPFMSTRGDVLYAGITATGATFFDAGCQVERSREALEHRVNMAHSEYELNRTLYLQAIDALDQQVQTIVKSAG